MNNTTPIIFEHEARYLGTINSSTVKKVITASGAVIGGSIGYATVKYLSMSVSLIAPTITLATVATAVIFKLISTKVLENMKVSIFQSESNLIGQDYDIVICGYKKLEP